METPEADTVLINHFSHHHPLSLISYKPSTTVKTPCSACKTQATGWAYVCESCDYYIHKACSKLPQKLVHNADKNHTLTLVSAPVYEGGEFVCNACGALGTGFCYHCADCRIDLHGVCSFMPMLMLSNVHEHELKLCFGPPYENSVFKCDICGGSGANHWLYRCESCEFDAHMKCAKATQKTLSIQLKEQA